jgi:hypothetical protein
MEFVSQTITNFGSLSKERMVLEHSKTVIAKWNPTQIMG